MSPEALVVLGSLAASIAEVSLSDLAFEKERGSGDREHRLSDDWSWARAFAACVANGEPITGGLRVESELCPNVGFRIDITIRPDGWIEVFGEDTIGRVESMTHDPRSLPHQLADDDDASGAENWAQFLAGYTWDEGTLTSGTEDDFLPVIDRVRDGDDAMAWFEVLENEDDPSFAVRVEFRSA